MLLWQSLCVVDIALLFYNGIMVCANGIFFHFILFNKWCAISDTVFVAVHLGKLCSKRKGVGIGPRPYPHTPACTPTRTHNNPGPYLPLQTDWEQFRQGRSRSGRSEGVVPTSQDDKGGWSTLWGEARIWIRFGQHSVSTNNLISWH